MAETSENVGESSNHAQLLVLTRYITEIFDVLETKTLEQVFHITLVFCSIDLTILPSKVHTVASTSSLFQGKRVLAIRPENFRFISDVTLSYDKVQIQSIVRSLKCGHSNLKRRLSNPKDPSRSDQKAIVVFLDHLPESIVNRAEGVLAECVLV